MATAGGCVTGEGSLSATSTVLSEAIAEAYATAITNLFAEVTNGEQCLKPGSGVSFKPTAGALEPQFWD